MSIVKYFDLTFGLTGFWVQVYIIHKQIEDILCLCVQHLLCLGEERAQNTQPNHFQTHSARVLYI